MEFLKCSRRVVSTSQTAITCASLRPAKLLRWPEFCLPTPMNPTFSRSLGAAFVSSPSAVEGMIVGAATAPATATAAAAEAEPFIRSRRVIGVLTGLLLDMWKSPLPGRLKKGWNDDVDDENVNEF